MTGRHNPTLDAIELNEYFEIGWRPDKIARDMRKALADVDYDTIVGTGMSGGIVIPQLARLLKKHPLIIRKEGVDTHAMYPAVGKLGHRWIFVDDFIGSGATKFRVMNAVAKIADAKESTFWNSPAWPTEFVGSYLYQNGSAWRPHAPSS